MQQFCTYGSVRGATGQPASLPRQKTHILRCARSSRYNVLAKYASARRFFARLGSEIFLSSLQSGFFINLLVVGPKDLLLAGAGGRRPSLAVWLRAFS
jgi:hypothetical protein